MLILLEGQYLTLLGSPVGVLTMRGTKHGVQGWCSRESLTDLETYVGWKYAMGKDYQADGSPNRVCRVLIRKKKNI